MIAAQRLARTILQPHASAWGYLINPDRTIVLKQ